LADAPPSHTQIDILYTNETWRQHVESLPIDSRRIELSIFDHTLLKLAKFRILPASLWRGLAKHYYPLAKSMLSRKCDVWIFPNQDAWSYFLAVPALVSVFDLMHRYERHFPEVSKGLKYYRRESHYKQICRFAKGILVDSHVGKHQIEESYNVASAKVHVLPFITPPRTSSSMSGDGDLASLPDKFFFYPAQFWAHKNHLRLLAALAELKKSVPDVQLVLAGSKKNNYSSVLAKIEQLGIERNVHMLGYVTDSQVFDLYGRARALIMPTFFGPTNIPPLEAMSYGCPVAVSRIYAMPEQLGDAAIYFDPTSTPEIADAMHRLWTDDALCDQLRNKGRLRNEQWTQTDFSKRLWSCLNGFAH
jgi:glycosyltransferase involved in cell wall biosynthesis